MRKIILTAVITLFGLSVNANTYSAFCDGFKSGFKQGYCNAGNYTVCPEVPTPACPPSPVGRNNFDGGFGIGYTQGIDYYCEVFQCE